MLLTLAVNSIKICILKVDAALSSVLGQSFMMGWGNEGGKEGAERGSGGSAWGAARGRR